MSNKTCQTALENMTIDETNIRSEYPVLGPLSFNDSLCSSNFYFLK